MPFSMTNHVQAVVIGANVYVGGGFAEIDKDARSVLVYALRTGSWTTLPQYENRAFGMAALNNQLVLVGGRIKLKNNTTNVLGVWDERSQIWTQPFPEMPTSRHTPSVISYQKWLVVAGGKNETDSYFNKLELLDTHSGQWYEGPSLPSGYSEMSSVINGNMWYLSRGFSSRGSNKHLFSVCLDELISQAISQTAAGATSPPTPSPWQTLTDPPLISSTVLVLNGALLAVGGSTTSAIHHYQPSDRCWVKVGDLPTKRSQCACAVLPYGEIFIAGGIVYGANNKCIHIGIISF